APQMRARRPATIEPNSLSVSFPSRGLKSLLWLLRLVEEWSGGLASDSRQDTHWQGYEDVHTKEESWISRRTDSRECRSTSVGTDAGCARLLAASPSSPARETWRR